jgi:hypothetical protein
MIRINKGTGYLLGIFLTFLIYLIGQAIFFIHTKKASGTICDTTGGSIGMVRERTSFFYACFTSYDGYDVKISAGSNLGLHIDDSITIIYKINNPLHARLNTFKTLWLIPMIIYVIPFAFIMALITGAYYGTKYIIISRKPWKIYFSNVEPKEEEWQTAEVINTTFKQIDS